MGDLRDELRQRIRPHAHPVGPVDFRGPMAQSGRVQQQIPDSDLAGGRMESAVRFHHLDVPEFRQELRHRIGQAEAPGLVQHHHGGRGHRLGHRVDPEHRSLGHRRPRIEILYADRLEVRELSVPGDRGDGAGDFPLRDEPFQQCSRVRERRGCQADRAWNGARKRRRLRSPLAALRFSLTGRKRKNERADHRCAPAKHPHFAGTAWTSVRPAVVPRLKPFHPSKYDCFSRSPFRYRSKYAVAK